MIFIFGFNHQKKFNAGPFEKEKCANCNIEDYRVLEKISIWFTVFFIPLIPYKFKYYLRCTVCNFLVELSKDEFETVEPLARLNSQVINGKITEAEYDLKRLRL